LPSGENPDCPVGDLERTTIPPAGTPTPDPVVLPDESVQKIAVDADRGRYLVGFAYRDHNYAADPNGPYVQHARNYDIRVVKYDDAGELVWDKTYDTGNDDYGFAIALDSSEDQPGLYVGGGVEVESGPHAWHDAVLLELDPATGCPVDRHFQSAGKGTTSAYYDIATDGIELYAVGERQRNEKLAGEFGALISVFSHERFDGEPAGCEGDHHIIGYTPDDGQDPALVRTIVRAGGLLDPTVAYAVELPEPACVNCPVLVGGRSKAGGWVDSIVPGDAGLAPFLSPGELGDISVQDLAVPGDRVYIVGSSAANDMRVLAYSRSGTADWAPKDLGKGRLRGISVDAYGAVYVVGRSDEEASAGLLFKFSPSGRALDRADLSEGFGVSFTDVAAFDPGTGVIAARSEVSEFDYGWLQVQFACDRSEGSCPPAGQ
jgi:hypothetical protein